MIVRVVLNGNINSDGSNFVRSLSAPTWDVPASYTWHSPHPETGRLGHAESASLVLDVDRRAIPCMAVRSLIEVSRAQTGSFLGLQYVSLTRRFARGACQMLCECGEGSRQRCRNVVFGKLVRGEQTVLRVAWEGCPWWLC